jgi:hypothetical protein
MNRPVQIIVGLVILVAASGASFYGGMVYGQSQAQSARSGGGRFANGTPGAFNPGQGGQGQRGGGLFGQISEIGDGYVVVTDNNGKQTKVQVTDTTLIEKNASVKLTDLATGDSVIISGSQGSDGSFTARSVQVAPAGRFGGPAAGGTPQAPSQ